MALDPSSIPTEEIPAERLPPLEFFIALLLLKSKPSNLSRQEYFTRLRSCIQDGGRTNQASAAASHIDTASYWKNRFEESENLQVVLRAEISELEIGRKDLRNDKECFALPATRGRKRVQQEAPKVPVTGMRTSQQDTAHAPMATIQNEILNPVVDVFLHRLYMLQQILHQSTHEVEALTGALCHTASAICGVVTKERCSDGYNIPTTDYTVREVTTPQVPLDSQYPSQTEEGVGAVLKAVGRAFPILLRGLEVLSQLRDSGTCENQVIYRCIKVFECLLQQVCSMAVRNAKDHMNKIDDDSSTMQMCKLIIGMMTYLERTKMSHAMILEGFLSLLFGKVGKGLERVVFGFEKETIYPQAVNNGGSASMPPTPSDHDQEEFRTIEAEGPYLTWILERAHSYTSQHHSYNSPHEPNVGGITRKKFQNTLLKAVFRESAPTDFQPALTSYPSPEPEILPVDNLQTGVEDWFKHEVWRIVGWDVLRDQGNGRE